MRCPAIRNCSTTTPRCEPPLRSGVPRVYRSGDAINRQDGRSRAVLPPCDRRPPEAGRRCASRHDYRDDLSANHLCLGELLAPMGRISKPRPSTARPWPATRSWSTGHLTMSPLALTWRGASTDWAACCASRASRRCHRVVAAGPGAPRKTGERRSLRHRAPELPRCDLERNRHVSDAPGALDGGAGFT